MKCTYGFALVLTKANPPTPCLRIYTCDHYAELTSGSLSGIFWAWTIATIVSVVHHMNSSSQQYRISLDKANDLIGEFHNIDDETDSIDHPKRVAKRIRKFIRSQYDHNSIIERAAGASQTLDAAFPALRGLSDELRRKASLQVMK